jgi:hypothetical protein
VLHTINERWPVRARLAGDFIRKLWFENFSDAVLLDHAWLEMYEHGRIIPGRWHRRREIALHRALSVTADEVSLVRLLYSTAGGGGPPVRFARCG